jgi:LacI family transcriptional regulator
MPTIKDVAQRAGVSTTTVSYVLNGTRYVSPSTEARILAVIKELDFKPNYIARSLRARRTMTVGMLVRGAQDVLSARRYTLMVCNTDENSSVELETLALLREKRVDGLIAVATGENVNAFSEASENGLPIVLVDRYIPGEHLCIVLSDDEPGAYQATQYLIQLGHRRIGVILGKVGISTSVHRRLGYEAALRDAGIEIDPALAQNGHSTVAGGAAAAKILLDLTPPPTAIFATNHLMTLGLFVTLKERTLRCPEDVAVISFDDMVWLSAFSPGLTTVAQPSYAMGKQAAELLWNMMTEKKAGNPCLVMLPTKLVIRESSGQTIVAAAN